MAGLSAAFHLTRAGVACEIHEASARLGGRMFSLMHFNADDMSAELGGEFVDTNHEDLLQLCKFFGIPVDSVDSEGSGLCKNIYYLRDSSGHPTSYRFDKEATKMMQLFDRQYKKDFAKAGTAEGVQYFDSKTLAEYLNGYRNRIDPWFLELLRIAYVGECGLEANEQSALLLVQTLEPDVSNGFKIYGDSDQAFRIRGGNINLISALENWLQNQAVVINKRSPLESISESTDKLHLKFGGETNKAIAAHRVICTIPFSVLKNIYGVEDLQMSGLKQACINEMVYGTNSKIIQGYQKRYWRFGSTDGKSKVPASNGMVYSNLFSQNIWETHHDIPELQIQPQSGILTSFLGGKDGASLTLSVDAAKNLLATEQIFPGIMAHSNSAQCSAMNWLRHPLNLGSYASARPHQLSRFGSIGGQVELSGKLYFAGEHVATKFQGFMNGACLSGRIAAEALVQTSARRKKTS